MALVAMVSINQFLVIRCFGNVTVMSQESAIFHLTQLFTYPCQMLFIMVPFIMIATRIGEQDTGKVVKHTKRRIIARKTGIIMDQDGRITVGGHLKDMRIQREGRRWFVLNVDAMEE